MHAELLLAFFLEQPEVFLLELHPTHRLFTDNANRPEYYLSETLNDLPHVAFPAVIMSFGQLSFHTVYLFLIPNRNPVIIHVATSAIVMTLLGHSTIG